MQTKDKIAHRLLVSPVLLFDDKIWQIEFLEENGNVIETKFV